MRNLETYGHSDVGCWIEAANGLGHACAKLAAMLESLPQTPNRDGLIEELHNAAADDGVSISDDFSELQDATDMLQEHTEDGLIWEWNAGDLCLVSENEL